MLGGHYSPEEVNRDCVESGVLEGECECLC